MRETQRLLRKTVLDAFFYGHCDPISWVTLGMQSSMVEDCPQLLGMLKSPMETNSLLLLKMPVDIHLALEKKVALEFSPTIIHCHCVTIPGTELQSFEHQASACSTKHSSSLHQSDTNVILDVLLLSRGLVNTGVTKRCQQSSENQVPCTGIMYHLNWE